MNYRIDKEGLYDRLSGWNGFMKKRVRLIACGGTALTLLDIKPSTKDIDLIVPDLAEYKYLIRTLEQLGYKPASGSGWARDDGFIFDLFPGKRVHFTELVESPLDKGNNTLIREFSHIYLGILNCYDLIITKLFRASSIDMEDCLLLIKNKKGDINIDKLVKRFKDTAYYDISETKVNKNLEHFLKLIKKEGLKW